MQRNYYAFRREELSSSLSDLEQAIIALEECRKAGDKDSRERAERKIAQVVQSVIDVEPHLAYLCFGAKREEAERVGNKPVSRRASDAANAIRDAWQQGLAGSRKAIPNAFKFIPDVKDQVFAYTPPLSFILRVPFRLEKPYISRDDCEFYLLDNPLRKEKIFKVPTVAASGWKGALRAALWQLNYKEDDEVTVRLLGNPRKSEEGQVGRLHFYPTFFDRIGIEVINPHSRESGVGERGPILMECVPEGTTGKLVLLYVPFGPVERGKQERRFEVAQDLEVLAQGIQAMLTTYGFGAKTSSGFGTAKDQLADQGVLVLRAILPDNEGQTDAFSKLPQPAQGLPRYLESPTRLHPDLRRPDGSIKSEEEYQALIESRKKKYTKKDKQLYEKAQRWWEREGRQLLETGPKEAEPDAAQTPIETPPVSKRTFTTLSELRELAQRVAAQLRNGGVA